MKSAVIYARVSSTNDRQDTGLNAQLEKLNKYAAEHNFKVLETFSEHVSGAKKKSERKALTECFLYCEQNKVSTILVSELSRIGRCMTDVFNTITEAGEKGITIIQVKDGTIIENDSIGGKALLFALSLAAEIERENIKYRLNLGRISYIENGGKLGRKEGYKKPKEEKADEYKEVIKMLSEAQEMTEKGVKVPYLYTIRGIAEHLREKGLKVSISTVQRIKKEFIKEN